MGCFLFLRSELRDKHEAQITKPFDKNTLFVGHFVNSH